MKINDIVDVKCIDVSYNAKGIAKLDKVVFVDNLLTGEEATIKIVGEEKNYYTGEVIKLLKTSKNRQKPCEHFNECGACDFSHASLSYEDELKKKIVENNLKRIGSIDINIDEVISIHKLNYRNKIIFHFAKKDNKYIYGFYKKESHDIVEIHKCDLIDNKFFLIADLVKNYCNSYDLDITELFIRKNSFDQFNIVIVLKDIDSLDRKNFINYLKNKEFELNGISLSNKIKDDELFGKDILIYGNESLNENINDIKYNVSNKSFLQINHDACELLYNKAIEYADLKENDIVLDMYCGIGSITLNIAKKVKKVYGVEIVKDAIKNARYNALNNNINNAYFECDDSSNFINKFTKTNINKVFLDPPRSGLSKCVIESIKKLKPEIIIYISCDSSTLARDLKELKEDYIIEKVSICNMFLRTKHVETVCLLERRN